MDQPGRIPQEKIEEVRRAADIVEIIGSRVRLKQAGKSFKGLCPFHGDKDPSLTVNPERGTWYCFGCQTGGNVFNFVMADAGLTFPEAVRELARRYGVALPQRKMTPQEKREASERERLLRILDLAGKFFIDNLSGPGGSAARRYLMEKRGLAPETIKGFGLGWAPAGWENLRRFLAAQGVSDHEAARAGLITKSDRNRGFYDRFRERVVFPIRSAGGRVISFGGRILDQGEPKYLNGPESPLFVKSKNLYNLDQARPAMRKNNRALVVEGYFDVISLAAQGFQETVAPMGTALTSEQVRLVTSAVSQVVLVFDGDQAGRKAALKSQQVFAQAKFSPKVLLLPGGEDPDSFVRGQGAPAFEKALNQAVPLTQLVLDTIVAKGDPKTPEGKSRIVQEAAPVLRALPDATTAWRYLAGLSQRLDLPEALVARQVGVAAYGGRGQTMGVARARLKSSGLARQGELLQTALANPAAARFLAESGAMSHLEDPDLAQIGQALAKALEDGVEPEAAAVISRLPDPALAAQAGRLAESAPSLSPDQAVAAAKEKLALLAGWANRKKLGELTQAMEAAQAAGDHDRVAELLAERRRISNSR